MKKILLLIAVFSMSCGLSTAQIFFEESSKSEFGFDWGAKVGFNSSLPIINSLTVNGQRIDNVEVQYNVGYMASLFWRFNAARFFIQPSVSWDRTSSNLQYDISAFDPSADRLTMEGITIKTRSLTFPILVGYNIVKEGRFGLSMAVGPKISYDYDTRFSTSFDNYSNLYKNEEKSHVNLVTGVGVKLWSFYFDFNYEFGLTQRKTNLRNILGASVPPLDLHLDSRNNMMGFSLGFLF